MDKEQTKYAIEVMQAFENGKFVQLRFSSGTWTDDPAPSWDWLRDHWRVKPGPITCWVTVLNNQLVSTVHMTEEEANNCVHPDRNPEWTVHKVVIE